MADEVQHYSSGGDSHKRKYEESTSPPPSRRRATGFSSPISAAATTPSGIELAKQRAQELASRFMNDAEAKRPKFENTGGFESPPSHIPDKKHMSQDFSQGSYPPAPASYGYHGSSKKIDIPNTRVGVVIGKGGETIKYLQLQSGAKIQVTRDMDADPNSHTRAVELTGTADQIAKAEQLIHEVLAEAETGGSAIVSRRLTGPAGSEQFSMRVPNNKVGLVIGKGGETIKSIQARTGARVQVIPLHLPPGDPSTERTVQIDGSNEQIEAAKQLVNEAISEVGRSAGVNSILPTASTNRQRNSGGYPPQGYQARPPTSWAPPGPPQSAYGYSQPGSYPSQPQYSAPPPPPQYPGYPPQQQSSGYPTNYWDPSGQQQQQTSYNYSQQPQQPSSGAHDNSGYGYNQGYGAQGYSQDGYSGGGYTNPPAPQPAYGQQPPPSHQGYDQSTYGSGTNPPPDGTQTAAAAYGTQQTDVAQSQAPPPPPSSGQQGYNMSHHHQPYGAQTGYGGYGAPPPQVQKPPAATNPPPPSYGQSGQSPSQGGGYGQVGAYSSYPQPRPPAAASAHPTYGTGAGQIGSYPPPYGAPSYGQAPPAQYGSGGGAYESSYPQASSAYAAADGSANAGGGPGVQASGGSGAGKPTSPLE